MTAHVVNHRRAYVSLAGSTQPVQGGNIQPFPGFFGIKVPAAEGKKKKELLCYKILQEWRASDMEDRKSVQSCHISQLFCRL